MRPDAPLSIFKPLHLHPDIQRIGCRAVISDGEGFIGQIAESGHAGAIGESRDHIGRKSSRGRGVPNALNHLIRILKRHGAVKAGVAGFLHRSVGSHKTGKDEEDNKGSDHEFDERKTLF